MMLASLLDAVIGWDDQDDRALLSCLSEHGALGWAAAAGEQWGVPPGLLKGRLHNLAQRAQNGDGAGAVRVARWSEAEITVLLHAALHVRARNEEGRQDAGAKVLASQLYAAMARFLPGRSAHAVRQTLTSKLQQHHGALTATSLARSASDAWQQLLTEWNALPVAQVDTATARPLASQLLEALDEAKEAAPAAARREPRTPSSGDGSSGHIGSHGAAPGRAAVQRSASIDAGLSLQQHTADASLAQAQQAAAQHLHHLPAASAPGLVAPAASSWQPADGGGRDGGGSGLFGVHGGPHALSLASTSMFDADVCGGADTTRSCPLPSLSSSWLQQQQERLQATWQAAASQQQKLLQLQAQCRHKQQCATNSAGVGPAVAGHSRRRKAPYPPPSSGLLPVPTKAAPDASPAAAAAAAAAAADGKRHNDARRQPSFSAWAAQQSQLGVPAACSAPLPAVAGRAPPAAARGPPAVAAEQLQAVQQTMQALEAMVAELTQVVDRMAHQQPPPAWGQPPQAAANTSAPGVPVGAARTLSAPLPQPPVVEQGLLRLMELDDAALGLAAPLPKVPAVEQGGPMELDDAALEDLRFRRLLEGALGSFNTSPAAAAAVTAAVTAGLESSRNVSASTAALAEAAAASDVWAQASGRSGTEACLN